MYILVSVLTCLLVLPLAYFIYKLLILDDINRELSDKNQKISESCKFIKKILSDSCSLTDIKENDLLALLKLLSVHVNFVENSTSNLKAIPYMASIVADYETIGIKTIADQLNWGTSSQRLHKAQSIYSIRNDAKSAIERHKISEYQLSYLLSLFPALQDYIDSDYNEIPQSFSPDLSHYDYSRDYISSDEYLSLSTTERNQLALDRYFEQKNRTKWQVGRDYELYVGYKFSLKGYKIEYFGENNGLEDLGRDLIAKKKNNTLIIQCKYWSNSKQIHEKHVCQLFGTTTSYCLENGLNPLTVHGVLITNTTLSDTAKRMANHLNIEFVEHYESGRYPSIKCNIGHDEYGKTMIYHLPFDQQYDAVKIDKPGEFFAFTVKEAEDAGFRRAYKWFGN